MDLISSIAMLQKEMLDKYTNLLKEQGIIKNPEHLRANFKWGDFEKDWVKERYQEFLKDIALKAGRSEGAISSFLFHEHSRYKHWQNNVKRYKS